MKIKRHFIKALRHPLCFRWMAGDTLGRYLSPYGSIYEWCGHNCTQYPCDLVKSERLKDDLKCSKLD